MDSLARAPGNCQVDTSRSRFKPLWTLRSCSRQLPSGHLVDQNLAPRLSALVVIRSSSYHHCRPARLVLSSPGFLLLCGIVVLQSRASALVDGLDVFVPVSTLANVLPRGPRASTLVWRYSLVVRSATYPALTLLCALRLLSRRFLSFLSLSGNNRPRNRPNAKARRKLRAKRAEQSPHVSNTSSSSTPSVGASENQRNSSPVD